MSILDLIKDDGREIPVEVLLDALHDALHDPALLRPVVLVNAMILIARLSRERRLDG